VKVELHHGDLADLAFMRADSVDLVFSAWAFGGVADLTRVFPPGAPGAAPRSAVGVLHAPPHVRRDRPTTTPTNPSWSAAPTSTGPRSPTSATARSASTTTPSATSSMGLTRNNFRVDALLEPESVEARNLSPHWREAFLWLPRTLVVRARKEGI